MIEKIITVKFVFVKYIKGKTDGKGKETGKRRVRSCYSRSVPVVGSIPVFKRTGSHRQRKLLFSKQVGIAMHRLRELCSESFTP